MILATAFLAAIPSAHASAKNPDTFVYLSLGDADMLDPAWALDGASNLILQNIYEPLFAYEGSSVEKLVPLIAEKVPSRANGLVSADGRIYRIPIRKGIRFHDGTPLSPEDVRYSILRFLLQDRDAGPPSLLLEPLLGYPSTRDKNGKLNAEAFRQATRAVQLQGETLVLRLPAPYAPLLTILAYWCRIVPKQWAIDNGDWDGFEASWSAYNNPKRDSSPLREKANGTGPFRLERWDRALQEIVLIRNDGYWRKPAKLKRVIVKAVPEFVTRKLMLGAGDADAVAVDHSMLSQLQGIAGIRIIDDLPTLSVGPIVFFTFQINPVANPNIGSGKLDGDGIAQDFFTDPDVRKGFAYAFDYAGYIQDVFRGKATRAPGFIPKGLPGYNPRQKTYTFDLPKAREHFQKAWGGKLWEAGFKFTMGYNAGNISRQNICQIFKRNIESLNPKFKIDTRPVEWPTFIDAIRSHKMPIFVIGYPGTYPDTHAFASAFLHSQGLYPARQGYQNPAADQVIAAAVRERNPSRRQRLYAKLIEIAYEEIPHLVIVDSPRIWVQQDWLRGWYHNPFFADGGYFYPLYKK